MSNATDVVAGEVARHHIANVLCTYVDIADRKDIDAAIVLLGHARVRFPAGGYDEPDGARRFFTTLWASPTPHRHDVTNLRVASAGGRLWRADAHYTRWLLESVPVLHTLGEYVLTIDERDWSICELTVTRTWTRG